MDTLTFNTPILFRHLTFSEAKKQPILEVDLKKALDGLDMTMSQVLEQIFLSMVFSDDFSLVYRTMPIARLRLPRANKRCRPQNGLQTDARAR